MKLQSLNESAFQKFENNTLSNLGVVIGGRYQRTGAGSLGSGVTYCCDITDDEGQKPTIYYNAKIQPQT
jgi:hypothetical protein